MFTSRTNQNLKVLSFIVVTVFGFQAISFAEPTTYNPQPTTPGYATTDVLARSANQDSQIQTLNSPEPLPQDAPPPVGGTEPLLDPYELHLDYEAELLTEVPVIKDSFGNEYIPFLALLGGDKFIMYANPDDRTFDTEAYIFDGETFTSITKPGIQGGYMGNTLGEYIYIELTEDNRGSLMADLYLVSGDTTAKLTEGSGIQLSSEFDSNVPKNRLAMINDRGDVLWYTPQDGTLHFYDAVSKEITHIENTGIDGDRPLFNFNTQGDIAWYDVSDSETGRVKHFKDSVTNTIFETQEGQIRQIEMSNNRMIRIRQIINGRTIHDHYYNPINNELFAQDDLPTTEHPEYLFDGYSAHLTESEFALLDYAYVNDEYLYVYDELYSFDISNRVYTLIDSGNFSIESNINEAGMIAYKKEDENNQFYLSDGIHKGAMNIVNEFDHDFDHPFETWYMDNEGRVFVVDQEIVILRPYTQVDPLPKRLKGDANEDGTVNLADFNILKGNFGKSFEIGAETEGEDSWGFGDFNGDDKIDLADFNVLKANFGMSADICETEPSYCV